MGKFKKPRKPKPDIPLLHNEKRNGSPTETKLTDKQKDFIKYFLRTFSYLQAAKDAGYAKPEAVAYQLKGNVKIQAEIARQAAGYLDKMKDETAIRCLKRLRDIALYDELVEIGEIAVPWKVAPDLDQQQRALTELLKTLSPQSITLNASVTEEKKVTVEMSEATAHTIEALNRAMELAREHHGDPGAETRKYLATHDQKAITVEVEGD